MARPSRISMPGTPSSRGSRPGSSPDPPRARGTLLLLLLLLLPLPAQAQWGVAPARQGAFLGLELGTGSGSFSVEEGDLALNSGWGSGGRIIRGRLGIALTEDLVMAGEYGVWRRTLDDGTDPGSGDTSAVDLPADRYLGVGLLSWSLYPRVGGLFLRAGLGYGRACAEIVRPEGSVTGDGKGVVVLMGVGWESWVDDDLSFSAQLEVGRFESGPEIAGNFAQFSAGANLWFSTGR